MVSLFFPPLIHVSQIFGVYYLTFKTEAVWDRAIEGLKAEAFVFCDEDTLENISDRVQQARDEQDPIMQNFIDQLMRRYFYVVYPLTGFIDEGFRRPSSQYYKRAFIDKEEIYLSACFKKCLPSSNCNRTTPKVRNVPTTKN
jgi:hypothetical protein